MKNKQKKIFRYLLIDFWKQSQGKENTNVVMYKQSMEHPEPQHQGQASTQPQQKIKQTLRAHVRYQANPGSLQVQKIRLR